MHALPPAHATAFLLQECNSAFSLLSSKGPSRSLVSRVRAAGWLTAAASVTVSLDGQGSLTWAGGEHTIQYTGGVSWNCTPETYIIN